MIKRCPQHGFFRGEHCECGFAGQLILDEAKTEQLGRLVAGGLRHFPRDLGLEMDSRGWVDLSKLGEVVQNRHHWASKEMVIALVQSDPKQRYEISKERIRARYGHSADIELDHPESHHHRLYYGASEEEADRILEIGLKPASQRYVHLSATPEKAWEVAGYRTGNPRVIQVEAALAREAGVKMMTVNDDIVISVMVPARFLCILSPKDIPKPKKD